MINANDPGFVPITFGAPGAIPGSVKTGEHRLYSIFASNRNAAIRYLTLHDSADAPSGTPKYSFLIPANGTVVLGTDMFTGGGILFSTGLTVGVSTSATTYTAATATDHDVFGTYR